MYDKFWNLVGKTKIIACAYLPLMLILIIAKSYFSVQNVAGGMPIQFFIINQIVALIAVILMSLVYVPVCGFILEYVFESEKHSTMYYLKKWYLQNLAFGIIIWILFSGILYLGWYMNNDVVSSLIVLILCVVFSKCIFYFVIAINEKVSVLKGLIYSWKRVSYWRTIKALWYAFLTYLPFIVISTVVSVCAVLSIGPARVKEEGLGVAVIIALQVISAIGGWFAGLVLYVHYWQLLIDEGKIEKPSNAIPIEEKTA